MTEERAIEVLGIMKSQLKDFGMTAKFKGVMEMQESAVDIALKSLSEIQQYRAIGTVEECRLYKGISEKDFSTACIDLKIIDELREYKNIGTVEECREARERQREKKPVWSPDCEECEKDGTFDCTSECGSYSFLSSALVCPNCKKQRIIEERYCPNCGQAIDWSDTP